MLFNPDFWIIIAVLLCVLEVFTGAFISLSFGISAIIIYGILKLFPDFVTTWYEILFIYGLLCFILSVIMWYFFGKKNTAPDINE
jgi:membrane protein implicated in regulation of membrane protease activity